MLTAFYIKNRGSKIHFDRLTHPPSLPSTVMMPDSKRNITSVPLLLPIPWLRMVRHFSVACRATSLAHGDLGTHPQLHPSFPGAALVAHLVKNPPTMRETWVRSLGWKILWRRAWQPTPVFLPGESPWTEEPGRLQSTGHKESDTIERLSTAPQLQLSLPEE